jgi:iron complex transport system substrate-binding protein
VKSYLLFYLLLTILCSCSTDSGKKLPETSAGEKRQQLFEIRDMNSYKLIYVFNGKSANDTSYTYVLYHKGTKKPEVNLKAQFIETPVEKAAVLSSLYIGCLEKLNLLEKVIAVDNKNYIRNAFIRARVESGEIKEIAKTETVDAEQVLALKPDLIIGYGMGNPETDLNQKVRSAGIPMAISLDHLETSALSRAQWLKFVASFFEKDKAADSILLSIETKYAQLKQIAATAKTKPKVLTEIKLSDAWFVPGGKSFMAGLLNDANTDYIWKDNDKTGSLALSYEEVYAKALDADYWLNLSSWNSLNDCAAQDERNKNFKAYKEKKLFNNNALMNAEGGNAYWETGLISPDEILADLVKIFHPELLPDHQLKYYQRLN